MHTASGAHYVKRNHITTLPRRFVYLDTEAKQELRQNARVQSFRLGVVAFERRLPDDRGWSERTFATHKNTADLWASIDEVTRAKARTVVVAHNLAYDLRISNALVELPKLGWEVKALKIDAGHAWGTFGRDGRTLALVDSMSWVPKSLEKLAPLVGMAKCALPAWDDSDAAWEARCTRDVEILAEVWHRLMVWIETQDLGVFRTTGAGQSWSAFRHRFMTHQLLVHEDMEARDAERQAAHTGRCEAWRHGVIKDGPFTEWDFTTAYATVGRECSLPLRLLRHHGCLSLPEWQGLCARGAVLSRVHVSTVAPSVPCRSGDRVLWPSGTFSTVLWDNELALAIAEGATVTIGESWFYERAPLLSDFCAWCLDQLAEHRTDVDPIVRLTLKHFSRAVVGRFGARWSKWGKAGTVPYADVRRWTDFNGDDDTHTEMLQVGTQIFSETARTDAPDCMPQVMSYVMAECRVRLWRAMQTAGLDHVVYVDTDSLITDAAGSAALRAARIDGLRPKGEWRSLEVLGPRQTIRDRAVIASGLPRTARKVGKASYSAEVWRQIDTSLRNGEASSVVITDRKSRLRGTDRRRQHLPGGLTAPFSLDA